MNDTVVDRLRAFLKDAHSGTDCATAEFYFALAAETLSTSTNKEEKVELTKLIEELGQMHNLCSTARQNEEDDDSECGF